MADQTSSFTLSLVNALNVLAGALSGGSASTSRSVQSQEQMNELSHMLSLNANQAALDQPGGTGIAAGPTQTARAHSAGNTSVSRSVSETRVDWHVHHKLSLYYYTAEAMP